MANMIFRAYCKDVDSTGASDIAQDVSVHFKGGVELLGITPKPELPGFELMFQVPLTMWEQFISYIEDIHSIPMYGF